MVEQLRHRDCYDKGVGAAARQRGLDLARGHVASVDHVAELSGSEEPAKPGMALRCTQVESVGLAVIAEVVAEAQRVRARDLTSLWPSLQRPWASRSPTVVAVAHSGPPAARSGPPRRRVLPYLESEETVAGEPQRLMWPEIHCSDTSRRSLIIYLMRE
jgi:hypothetical protein